MNDELNEFHHRRRRIGARIQSHCLPRSFRRRTKDDNITKRVRDAAEQLNYQANSAASALRSDTTNTIGLIMPGPTDPLAARLLAELEPEVNRSGRQLLLGLGDDQRTQTERIEAMLARRVDGLVVMPPQDANTAAFLNDHVGMTSLVQAFGHSTSFHVNWVASTKAPP